MQVFQIEHWDGGISSFSDRGIRGAAKFLSGVDIRKTRDTLSCQQALVDEGLLNISHSSSPSLSPSSSVSPSSSASRSTSPSPTPSISNSPSRSPSPSQSPSRSASLSPSGSASPSSSVSASPSSSGAVNNVFVGLILFFVKCTDGNTYGFDNTGHIYRRYTDGYWKMVYTDPHGSIKGAEEKPSSTGATYLQWATDTKVKQKAIPGDSNWGDVEIVAENLTGAPWHTMRQIGGANMISNGSRLAMVGYDNSYTNEALDLIPGNVTKTLTERSGRAVIGTYKAGYPNKGVNAMLDAEVPLSQIGDDGELFFADFTNSMPAKRFPGGGRVNPGGAANEVDQVQIFDWEQTALTWVDKQTMGNMSLWGVFGADENKNGVYTYGRRHKEQPFTMVLEYALEVDEIGAVANVEGTTIVSYRDGSEFGVKAVDPNNKATGYYESLEFRAPIKSAEQITRWGHIELFMEALPAGCSIEVFYKMNHASGWSRAYTASGDAAYSSTGGKKATFRLGEEGDVYEHRIVLNPAVNVSPEVIRSRTYFD